MQTTIIMFPDEVRIGNYVHCIKSEDSHLFGRTLRVIGLTCGIGRHRNPATTYRCLIDVISTDTKHVQYGLFWNLGTIGAIPISPALLIRLGFTPIPLGVFPTDLEHVYIYAADAETSWIVSFDELKASLWMVLDGEERCVAELNGIHHLQNLLLDLQGIRLRFDNDQDSAYAIRTDDTGKNSVGSIVKEIISFDQLLCPLDEATTIQSGNLSGS